MPVYPAFSVPVPVCVEKAGYTGAWQRYTAPVHSNVTVSATYTKITTYYTVTFVADGFTVKTMQVYSGYILKDSDYPSVPEKLGCDGHGHKWRVFPDNRIDFVK